MARIPRTGEINEKYYAQNNEPSYYQFGKDYHFVDLVGNKYKIAAANEDVFQNLLMRFSPDSRHCRSDYHGEVTLYVKLKKGNEWFDDYVVQKEFPLFYKNEREKYVVVKIESAYRENYKRRSGSIQVSKLGVMECNKILADRTTALTQTKTIQKTKRRVAYQPK